MTADNEPSILDVIEAIARTEETEELAAIYKDMNYALNEYKRTRDPAWEAIAQEKVQEFNNEFKRITGRDFVEGL